MQRDPFRHYVGTDQVVGQGVGEDVEQRFAKTDFLVTDRALLVHGLATLRLDDDLVQSARVVEDRLHLVLKEPSDAEMVWRLRQPDDWAYDYVRRVSGLAS